MEMYELKPLISSIHNKNKESWEQTRLLGYLIAQVNSTKKLEVKDIMKFPWDEENDSSSETSIKNEDIKRLRLKAKKYLNNK